ncbi:uncharacterized protein LOC121737543 [Aricia agestis]|uniref:uncharacterized protein LOC121737543 n=1 Tax=Aricia agestis TaxID=91739 RepID=UPI001C20782B|nr:uncharacterized protein LOC121737543 [Aricia agestis]
MKVLWVLLAGLVLCSAAPGSKDDEKLELFSGVAIEKDQSGEEKLNVKFEPGELRDAARTFEEARGKLKKYTPLIAGIGVKVVAIAGLLFGALTLLVTKALVVAKLALMAAAALGIHKYLNSNNQQDTIQGKIGGGYQAQPQQWAAPSAPAASYPYARAQEANDLAYKAQFTQQ